MALNTLKKRSEFLRIRGGIRFSSGFLILEARPQTPLDGVGKTITPGYQPASQNARFGLTITKKLGGAVIRNRLRRRLKAALAAIQTEHADAGYDYVIVAKTPLIEQPFAALTAELVRAFRHIRRNAGRSAQRKP